MKQKILVRMTVVLMIIAVVFSCVLMVGINGSTVRPVEKEYATTLFQKDQIMEVNIIIDEDDWQDMLDNALDETYIPCDVEVNGVTYQNVAIRPKGNTSLSQVTNDRYSFKIQFDKYQDGQTCDGLDQLVLNNNFSDATYMREYIAYDMFQYMGVVTPLYSYADVKVNGETYGLYLALEGVKESFAERNYGTDHGELYKPESTNAGGGGGNHDGKKGMDQNNAKDKMNADPTDKNQDANTSNTQSSNEKVTDTTTTETSNETSDTDTNDNTSSGGSDGEQNDETNTTDANSSASQNPTAPPDGMNMPSSPDGQNNSQNDKKDPLEQGGGMGNSSSSGTDLVYTDDDPDSYSAIFDSAVFDITTENQKSLIAALKGISTGENLTDYMDVEATLKYFAVNSFLVNYDSYTGNLKHNYYLYEKDGILTMLPWDLNLAFAGYQSNDATSAINDPIDTPVSGTTLEERPMIGQLLNNDTYMEEYHNYIDQLVTGYVESGRYEAVITQLKELISDYVKNDPTAFYTYDEYVEAVKNLESFIELRGESVRGQLDGTVPSTEEGQKENSDSLIDAGDLSITAMGTMGGGMNHDKGGFGGKNMNQDATTQENTTTEENDSITQNTENSSNNDQDDVKNSTGSDTSTNTTNVGSNRNAIALSAVSNVTSNSSTKSADGNSGATPPSGNMDGNSRGTPPSGNTDGNSGSTPPSGNTDGNSGGTPPSGNTDENSTGSPSTGNSNGGAADDSSAGSAGGSTTDDSSTGSTDDSASSSETTDANEQEQTDSDTQNRKNSFPNGDMKDKMEPGSLDNQDDTKQVVMVAGGSIVLMAIMCLLMWKWPRRKYRS